jgi:chromosome segregation ATPase
VAEMDVAAKPKRESRILVFWSLCGGSVLSIAAMVLITLYQQFVANLSELRSGLERLNESRGDLVKKDEFNNRMASVWSTMKDFQSASTTIASMKEQVALIEQQCKDHEAAGAAVSALKERCSLLEQQVKAGEEERKDLARELQSLRERQAVVEGRLGARTTALGSKPSS